MVVLRFCLVVDKLPSMRCERRLFFAKSSCTSATALSTVADGAVGARAEMRLRLAPDEAIVALLRDD